MHYKVRCWSLSQENKYAFNARRNCWMVRSDWRRLDERLFHSRSPATGNDLETRQLYCNLVEYYSFVWREWKWRTVVWKLRIEYKPKKRWLIGNASRSVSRKWRSPVAAPSRWDRVCFYNDSSCRRSWAALAVGDDACSVRDNLPSFVRALFCTPHLAVHEINALCRRIARHDSWLATGGRYFAAATVQYTVWDSITRASTTSMVVVDVSAFFFCRTAVVMAANELQWHQWIERQDASPCCKERLIFMCENPEKNRVPWGSSRIVHFDFCSSTHNSGQALQRCTTITYLPYKMETTAMPWNYVIVTTLV